MTPEQIKLLNHLVKMTMLQKKSCLIMASMLPFIKDEKILSECDKLLDEAKIVLKEMEPEK